MSLFNNIGVGYESQMNQKCHEWLKDNMSRLVYEQHKEDYEDYNNLYYHRDALNYLFNLESIPDYIHFQNTYLNVQFQFRGFLGHINNDLLTVMKKCGINFETKPWEVYVSDTRVNIINPHLLRVFPQLQQLIAGPYHLIILK